MDGSLGGQRPWSTTERGFPGPSGLSNDGMLGAGGSINLGPLTAAAISPPAATALWSPSSEATERGEFAQGFLWFDVQPGLGYGLVKPEPAALPLQQPPLPYHHQHHHQILAEQLPSQTLVPMDLLYGDDQLMQQQALASPLPAAQPAPPHGGRGRAGGTRGGRGVSSEEERRARNRATQARFRERQKAKNEVFLVEHAAAEAQLDHARTQQQDLQAHNTVLQKMLSAKDGVIAVLDAIMGAGQVSQQEPLPQQQGPAAAPATSSANAVAPAEAASPQKWSGSGCLAGLSSNIQHHMEWLGHELTAQMAMLELPATAHPDEAMAVAHAQLAPLLDQPLPLMLGEEEVQEFKEQLAEHQAAHQVAAASSSSDAAALARSSSSSGATAASVSRVATTPHNGGSRRSGPQPFGLVALFRERPGLVRRVMALTADEFVADWVEKAKAFRDLLASYDLSHSNDDLERILDIFRAWGGTLSLTLHLKPDNAQALFATAGNAPPGTWEVSAASIRPTRAQRTMLQQLWHAHAGRARAIRAERAAAVAAVQHVAQLAEPAGAITPGTLPASTLGGMTSQYLSLFDAVGKLSTLRDAEFIAMLQLMGRVGAVFSPVQKARLVAACYPHFPDVVQILQHLATTQGQLLPDQVAVVPEQVVSGWQ